MPDAEPAPPRRLSLLGAFVLSQASIAATVLVASGTIALAARAWTWVQLAVAGIGLAFAVSVLVLTHRPKVRRVAYVLAVLALVRAGWAFAPRWPDSTTSALVRTRYAHGDGPHALWFGGIPERHTMRLGSWVGLAADEYKEAGALLDGLYADIEESDLFERRESPLLDSWFRDREHFWLAIPEKRAGPVPLIIFVHGDGGTFQFYPWLLAREAVARGFAIAFPSHRLGFPGGEEAAARLGRVVDAVAREVPIDVTRVSLVGLSGGGPAVFGAALHDSRRYRSLVTVSAIAPELSHAEPMRGVRVLLLHGTEDPRARIEWIRTARDQLTKAGVPVELREEKTGHLALATSDGKWPRQIFEWLEKN